MKMGFEVIRGLIVKARVTALGIIVGDIMRDFQSRFRQAMEAATVE